MGKYQEDARLLLEYVGGKENIAAVSHCVSRMRFVLNDPAKADVAKIEALKSAKGTFTQAGQFQVIIGNTVSDFYNDFIAVSGIDGVSKDAVKSAAKQNQTTLQKIMSALAEIFAPLIPAIITGGLILGFRNCIDSIYFFENGTKTLCDISQFWSGVDSFLWLIGEAIFHMLPVCICWSVTKKMGTTQSLGIVLGLTRKTKATSIIKEEARKLFVLNGAAVFLAAFLAFGVYQGVTSESYIDADEIYYAYYMKHISGPWTAESRDWLTAQGEEFAPMLAVQRRVARGELSNEAMLAYGALQQKYNIYQQVVQNNINYYLKEHPGAWLVYESGYKKLFGFSGTADVQDTLWAGLLCALCFSGLFAMERKGGMDEILASTPLGRKYTVKAKLRQSTAVAAVIAFGTVLPHLWQVLRDYGLPSLLGPAMSISDLQAVPKFITLSDLLIFWLICRFAACLCMSRITLWLGQKLGNLLTALFISAVTYCLPTLLSLSGMKNGIEWLGFYPLFHAAALWQNQGYNANGESYNAMWIPIFLVCAAFFLAWAIGQALIDDYDMIGVPDEVL